MQGVRPSRCDWRKDGEFRSFICRFSTNLHLVRRTIVAIAVEMSRLRPLPVWEGRAVQSYVPDFPLYVGMPEMGAVSLSAG